jgi:hypothetical protein
MKDVDERLDEALELTFPASDPIAVTVVRAMLRPTRKDLPAVSEATTLKPHPTDLPGGRAHLKAEGGH